MPRRRPAVVTVMAILNIIFGSLGILCSLCSATSVLMNMANINRAGMGGPDPSAEIWKAMADEIPAYLAVQVCSLLANLLLSVVLLASGIGLLKMQNWARLAALSYAILDILVRVGSLVYHFAFVNPVMQRAMNRMMQAQFRQVNRPPPDVGIIFNIMNVAIIGFVVLFVIYDVVLLVTMLLPSVTRAFGETAAPEDYDRFEEYDDDLERERRRREEWSE